MMDVRVFTLKSGPITSIVMDEDEYEGLVQEMGKTGLVTPQRVGKRMLMPDEIMMVLRKAKHVPVLHRSPMTEDIFKKYNIHTQQATFTIFGYGHLRIELSKPEIFNVPIGSA